MARSFEVRLSDFAVGALARGEPRDSEQLRHRSRPRDSLLPARGAARRPGWSVPSTLREERDGRELELELDGELLRQLEAEARKQDVSLSRLVSQAAIYYAAELDAGRITQRVLDDLGEDD